MKIIKVFFLILYCSLTTAYADNTDPVTFYLSFDNFDFLNNDFVHETGKKTIDDRGLKLAEGRFGKALHISSAPRVNTDMSSSDLDMITAIVIDNFYVRNKNGVYKQPFFWGSGRIHPAYGAVSFWIKAPTDSGTVFQQTTSSWGRTEKELIEIVLERNGSLRAYVEDARYVQHIIRSKPVWKAGTWNHIVLMWDRSSGLELWFNGKKAESSMGNDAWWENQRSGLFHCGMPFAVYDEFYSFNRTLTPPEIKNLYRKNIPPTQNDTERHLDGAAAGRLKKAFTTDPSSLPVVRVSDVNTLVFHNITPDRIHDEGITGWWLADGRYECAWPHEHTIFSLIPGDVDFVAEKAEILPPLSADINYITFEGNLDGVKIFKGDRNGNFNDYPAAVVPETEGFFYGTTVDGPGNSELCIPFTKSYGVPKVFNSDVLKLPLAGDLRLHEVGLYNVSAQPLPAQPGDRILKICSQPPLLENTRYQTALRALLSTPDRTTAGLFETDSCGNETIAVDTAPMTLLNLISEPAVGKSAFDCLIFDLWVTSPSENNILSVRLLNPAVPSQTWTHAEVRLRGFLEKPSRLRLALRFDPLFLVSGDRIWVQLFASDGLSIITGDSEHRSQLTVRPVIDWAAAEPEYSFKTMQPNILTWGRMFEFIPWDYGISIPDVDVPEHFGGPFDTSYPWQAVLKVNPGDRVANIYRAFGTNEYPKGRHPADLSKVAAKTFDAPSNAPDWAVYFRQFQTFRNRIITWWRYHQRSDGQLGGGWNDDILIYGKGRQGYGDLPLDSNPDALAVYNNVFDGFDRTDYYKDGYCRVWPTDQGHNGDFVRDRFKSLIYNPGDPRSAVWAMEEAWHWGKPEQTPVNYGNGSSFLFGLAAIEWYWNKRRVEKPYVPSDRENIIAALRTAASVHNDTTFWRYTDAWNHIDDQRPYGFHVMLDILNGGIGDILRYSVNEKELYISIGVGWPEGGGPDLARFVEYSGNDGLEVNMYSFDTFERKVTARLFRLDSGLYSVTLRADNDADGEFETVVSEREESLKRFERLEILVPPKVPCFLEIKQIRADTVPENLPDLATSDYYIRKDGDRLIIEVYNIGTAPSGQFTLKVIDPRGSEIATVPVASLESSGDFIPKHVTVTIPGIPERKHYRISLDSENTVGEIYEENNIVEFIPDSGIQEFRN